MVKKELPVIDEIKALVILWARHIFWEDFSDFYKRYLYPSKVIKKSKMYYDMGKLIINQSRFYKIFHEIISNNKYVNIDDKT